MNKSILISFFFFIGLASSNAFSKKLIPVLANPIISKGVRYQADQLYKDLGTRYENMGIIKAIDLKTNKELWRKQLYKIELTGQMEKDNQMVFITDMQIDTVQNELIIKNEFGDIYQVNLQNQEAYQIIKYPSMNKIQWDCPVCRNCEMLPSDPPSMVKRAHIYFDQKKYSWAKTFYERALKFDSSYATAHLGLAKVAKAMKDSLQYRIELEKAKLLAPSDSEVIYEVEIEKKAKK